MAKDLGTITHEIKTTGGSGDGGGGGGKSTTDAILGSGRSGGGGGKSGGGGGIDGIGDVIRGVSRGGVGGGGQAMARVMGMAKLAAGIGVAIAAVALFAMAIKKVIGTLIKWTKEILNGISKFSAYNAQLAAVSAMAHAGKIRRDIKSANVLAGSYALTGRSMERIQDAFRPVSDAWQLVKANIVNSFMPVLERLVEGLRLLTIKVLEALIWMQESGITFGKVMGTVTDVTLFGTSGLGFSRHVLGLGTSEEADQEMLTGMKQVLKELKKLNENEDIKGLNQFIGEVGVQLTGGRWNPWQNPGTHMIPTGMPTSDPNQSQYDRENRIHP